MNSAYLVWVIWVIFWIIAAALIKAWSVYERKLAMPARERTFDKVLAIGAGALVFVAILWTSGLVVGMAAGIPVAVITYAIALFGGAEDWVRNQKSIQKSSAFARRLLDRHPDGEALLHERGYDLPPVMPIYTTEAPPDSSDTDAGDDREAHP
jgi:hypothetical protein